MCIRDSVRRAQIIVAAAAGATNETIATWLQVSLPTVRKWRRRWKDAETQLAVGEATTTTVRTTIATVLADAPRSGAPVTFSAEQIVHIVNLACTAPGETGRPVTAWTPRELADEAIKQGIVTTISARTVGRFLK